MIELTPDLKDTRFVSVFLDGVDVTSLCFYALVPYRPNCSDDGCVKLFKLDKDGKKHLDGNVPAQETKHGLVFWTWKKECPYDELMKQEIVDKWKVKRWKKN